MKHLDKHLCRAAACAALLGAGTAHAAGTVQVDFVAPDRYSDAGTSRADEEPNRDTLARYLQDLGERYLPDGDVLQISVLDIDLAGHVRPARRGTVDIRVVRGGADWPRIKLRYTLRAGDKVLQSAEETVADLDYLSHRTDYAARDPLRYEKRMLADWFRARFVEHRPAAG
jgi:hypothetical protein